MMDALPTELAVRVLQTAASELRFINRTSVVNLARTSSMVYSIVAPILYHTLIISRRNRARIAAFTYDESTQASAKRVCSGIRVFFDYGDGDRSVNAELLTNAVIVLAGGMMVRDIATIQCQTGDPPLREISIRSIDFVAAISWIPQRSRQAITHVAGLLPLYTGITSWKIFFPPSGELDQGPRQWTRSIINSLPALTHIALLLEVIGSSSGGIGVFDLGALSIALRAALEFERLEVVVLKVAGAFAEQKKDAIEELVRDIRDPRMRLLVEHRQMETWEQYDELSIEDVVAGRDIWTRATPMRSYR